MSNVTAKFTVSPREAIETEFRINATILDHDKLYNRDLPNQHPMTAITGLQTALADKQDILTSENAGTGISIETVDGVVKINNTQNSAEWGQIGGDINQQTDLKTALDNKQDKLTQVQLDAVNSGITDGLVAKISTNETAINNHIANKSNPHEVTKAQVGLGNVDNTSDLNKPISTATQTALDAKQNTIADLSTIRSGAALGATAVQPETLTTELLKKQDVLTAGDNIMIENNVISAKDTVYTAGNDIEIVKGSGGILPQGYQELEYIEADNEQYIDTGFTPDNNTRVVVDFMVTSYVSENPTYFSTLFCARTSATISAYGEFICSQDIPNGTRSDYDTQQVNQTGSVNYLLKRMTVDKNKNVTRYFYNGSVVSTTTITPSTFNTPYNVFLFKLNSGGAVMGYPRIKMYSCKIYDNDVLVRDFIPAKHNSGNVVGMYDLVTNYFFINAGNGSFIEGPAITLPTGYKQVEYIESTGTQWIDTGFIATNGMIVDARIKQVDGEVRIGSITLGSQISPDLTRNNISFNTAQNSYAFSKLTSYNNYFPKPADDSPVIIHFDTTGTKFYVTANDTTVVNTTNGRLLNQTNTVKISYSDYEPTVLKGRYYYVQIRDDNGTLVRDFVPCLDTNNVACMYDKVGKQTYYNSGTGEFTAGEVVGDELIINFTNESGYVKSSDLTGYEQTSNKVTSLSSSSTDTEYPSAKCVYDIVGDIESLINAL